MKNLKAVFPLYIVAAFLMSACAVFSPPEAAPWPTATATALPTKTPVWFPATATNTPRPPATPVPSVTPNQYPGIDALILKDGFLADDGWPEFRKNTGSAVLGPGELTLSVTDEDGYVTIFRSSPTVDDFYLEVQANPRLCQVTDSYGLLVRAASGLDYYRFSVSAEGQIRADRFRGGNVVVLQAWEPSGQVPRGCPVSLKLGVWAVGDELRFFVNDVFQFSVEDAAIARGQIGFFARSKSETVLSVTFSDLELYWVNPSSALATATPEPLVMLTMDAEEGGH
ncbi:MAG: hypothetical protein RBT34_00810 [Anaerolineaceae bacterium]|nr:hypothetical protein [Anaerolineaceae bacterium]